MDKNIVNEIFPALTSRVFVLNFLRGIETIEFSIIEEPKFHQTLNHVLEGFFRIVFYGNDFLSIHFLVNSVVTFVHFIQSNQFWKYVYKYLNQTLEDVFGFINLCNSLTFLLYKLYFYVNSLYVYFNITMLVLLIIEI